MRALIALCLCFLALSCFAADTPDMSLYLKKTDIFDGDVRGTYRSLLLKQPAALIQKTIISSTTIPPQDGADITNLDASNILQGILPWARLDVMTGGDLSGYLPAPQVIDDSHNHTAATLFDILLSTSAIYSKTVYSGTLGQGDTFYAFVPDTDITLGTVTATVHYHGTSGSSTFFCGNSSGLSVSVLSSDSVGALKSAIGAATISSGSQVSCFMSSTDQTITPVVDLEILYTKD